MPSTKNLIYADFSYKIVGILFNVYNELGPGHHEKYYQKAIAKEFTERKIKFKEQVRVPLQYKGEKVGVYFLDFLVEEKIILEIKRGDYFPGHYYEQVNAYLKASGLKLAILANFSSSGVKFRRIVNVR